MARPELLPVWRFVRGDTKAEAFEQWVYASPHLEELFGATLHFAALSVDYRDRYAIHELRKQLSDWVRGREELHCQCVTLSDLAVVDMGDHTGVFATLREQASRGEPFWWLSVYRCSACGEGWLVAQEERQNDVFCLRRLNPEEIEGVVVEQRWPTDFDRYEDLLRIGMGAGRAVDFVDPLGSRSLRATIEDLARARPGIRVEELARLLHLDLDIATRLARAVVEATGVTIEDAAG
jgi:hypothetical protein